MCTVSEMLRRLNSIDVIEMAADIVDEHQQKYLDLIKGQLKSGKDKTGAAIIPSYLVNNYANRRYAIKKYASNSLPGYGNPDLYLSGSLYEALKLARTSNTLTITSSVSYFEHIDKKYGEQPFGLDEDSKDIYRENVLFPLLSKRINLTLTGV